MEVHDRSIYPRAAVLFVLFLLHGGLVFVLLRERPDHRGSPDVPEAPTTVFFINSLPRASQSSPEPPRIAHRPTKDPRAGCLPMRKLQVLIQPLRQNIQDPRTLQLLIGWQRRTGWLLR